MEFSEKLQELRKIKGLTQEELAQALYVSRTAVSKWESAKGYPSIDSLKEISQFFSVSIDDLLSSEKAIFIAEKENKTNITNICEMLFGIIDLFSIALVTLPLYPKALNGYIYSVPLTAYTDIPHIRIRLYWSGFALLFICGMFKLIFALKNIDKYQNITTIISITTNIIYVLLLALSKEPYAVVIAFMLFTAKCMLILKAAKKGK